MASAITTSSIHSPINASRLSSLRLSRNRISPSNVLFKTSSLSLSATKATRFSFPPFPENGKSLVAKTLSFPGWTQQIRLTSPVVVKAAADAEGHGEPAKSFGERFPALVTGFFFFTWYFLNVIFNILNKKVYNHFPYPYFVSVVHLLVGVVYCLVSWGVGLPKRAPIDKELRLLLTPVAFCHALGHVMSNVSFAAVAVSFTHTVKGDQI